MHGDGHGQRAWPGGAKLAVAFGCTLEGITPDPPDRSKSWLRLVPESPCRVAVNENDYRRFDHLGSESDEDSAVELTADS